MHPNFYHWHARVELKPDTAILEARWKASEAFAADLSPADLCSLVRLVLFPAAEPAFAGRFSGALVASEPTFPIEKNAELLRVMAAAAVHVRLEASSLEADALALGLRAGEFPANRIEPVCGDVMTRAAQYLGEESDRMRPTIFAGSLERAEQQAKVKMAALKKAVAENSAEDIAKTAETLGTTVLEAMKESHQRLGAVIGRMVEEMRAPEHRDHLDRSIVITRIGPS